jgi:NADP-dependent 3-hydroxy acid dehydrogenase YdfG|tara:strand:- start:2255 stop:2557 length:303 start_codon:yes stop_codon:yes gene_type:complete
MLKKDKRWESKKYTNWVATLNCVNCNAQDGTVVAHHLKGRLSPLSGGAGYKASDWLTMPLCYGCHTKAHSGDIDVLDWQPMFILKTLDTAFKEGIIDVIS